ncbi:hypothetical protein [Embleya sp. NPDC059237]|uniref:hypothetical protein n=1 Tax=Embleya sp. NPDC059237 TaxID=3346784 RepID=UPI0036CD20E2
MPRSPHTVHATAGPLPQRPVLMRFDAGARDGIDLNLTVEQAWDVVEDLAAILARHPAPTARPPRPATS